MNRITKNISEIISISLDAIPNKNVRKYLNFDICTENPIFVGLHSYPLTDDGRLLSEIPHTFYGRNKSVIVIPTSIDIHTFVHELGHVLHRQMGWIDNFPKVSQYAHVNKYEAFAEAFTLWALNKTPYMWANYFEVEYDPCFEFFDKIG